MDEKQQGYTHNQPPPSYDQAQGGAPPPAGFAPPPAGYSPGQVGYASPPAGYALPPSGYAPPPGTQAPPPQAVGGPVPAGVVTTNVVVVRGGRGCPYCATGVIVEDFTLCGIVLAVLFFPIGVLCCLLMRRRYCNVCGGLVS